MNHQRTKKNHLDQSHDPLIKCSYIHRFIWTWPVAWLMWKAEEVGLSVDVKYEHDAPAWHIGTLHWHASAICIYRNIALLLYWCVGSWQRHKSNYWPGRQFAVEGKSPSEHFHQASPLRFTSLALCHSLIKSQWGGIQRRPMYVWDWTGEKRSCR